AQRGVVGHRVQVRDRRPGAGQALLQPLLRQHHVREVARRAGRGERIDRGAVVGKDVGYRRRDVLGADARKRGQRVVGQQRVVVIHGSSFRTGSVASAPGEIKRGRVTGSAVIGKG